MRNSAVAIVLFTLFVLVLGAGFFAVQKLNYSYKFNSSQKFILNGNGNYSQKADEKEEKGENYGGTNYYGIGEDCVQKDSNREFLNNSNNENRSENEEGESCAKWKSLAQGSESSFRKEDYIRIHIKAKSDGAFDQEVKLRVRDAVVKYLGKKLGFVTNKRQAIEIISKNAGEIKATVDEELKKCGADYLSGVFLSRESFPEKTYGQKVFPAGVYDALTIKLDQGNGANWWCVAYPPLCFIGGRDNPDAPDEIRYESLILKWIERLRNKT